MIYNDTGASSGYRNAHGLSVWVETGREALLFDTGGDGSILHGNLLHAGLDPARLAMVVVSHHHWDHKNGLETVLEMAGRPLDLYLAGNDYGQEILKHRNALVHPVSTVSRLASGVWTTGLLPATYRDAILEEQFLVLETNGSLVLLTGCSHPGIGNVVRHVSGMFPGREISLVAGGFHLGKAGEGEIAEISGRLLDYGVGRIAPSHCTGEEAIAWFRNEWGDRFVDFNLGDELTL